MTKYKKIINPYEEIFYKDKNGKDKILAREWIELLNLLEEINPCSQLYEMEDGCFIVSYKFKLNIFNFKKSLPLYINLEIIGLPISLSHRGYFGDINKVIDLVEKRKGLKLILNADSPIKDGGRTLSTFIFHNRFDSFKSYLSSMRSSYRRRINMALSKREKISINKIYNKNFSRDHYELYLNILKRTDNPLEILPIEFFREYESEIYEFLDKDTKRLIGFIQIKQIENKLFFLFGGFNKEDNKLYDLYYNMLLKIVEIAIEKKVKSIDFGQTAEESKLKLGCIEKPKYLYIHHSNPLINKIIRSFVGYFSYKPYGVKHKVFKD